MPPAKKAAATAAADPIPADVVPADLEHAVRRLAHAIHHREPVDFQGESVPQWVQDVLEEEFAAPTDVAVPGPIATVVPELCPVHFPGGLWPNEDHTAVACEHGSWVHPGKVPGVTVLDGEVVTPAAAQDAAPDGEDMDQDVEVQF